MPIPAALQTTLDASLASLQAKVDAYQPGYLVTNGRYWQGIQTPAVVPADGVLGALDLTVKPTDQTENWQPLAVVVASAPLSVACHTHNGPLGKGYTIHGTVMVSGQKWVRAIGLGAHSQNFDWTLQVEEL